jgi:hypothetical protein
VQFPTDGHDTELTDTAGLDTASPGSGAVAAVQLPDDWVSKSPWTWLEES